MSHVSFFTPPRLDAAATRRASELFQQGLHEDSNLELDWLWLATVVTRDYERVYCLQRALWIDPHSELAARGLASLSVHASMPRPFSCDDTKGECTR